MSETIENGAETMEAIPSTASLKRKANKITTRRTIYAAGAGLIPFPMIDIATLLGVQVIMIRDISRVYGVDFKEQRVRSLITTLVGDLGAVGVMSGVKAIPIVGSLLGGFSTSVTGAAATYALGKVFTQHFDQGGTLLNFDPVKSKKYFQEAYEEGRLYVEDLSEDDGGNEGWFKRKSKKESASTAELEELRQKNEEMKHMIAQLQQSIEDLKKSK